MKSLKWGRWRHRLNVQTLTHMVRIYCSHHHESLSPCFECKLLLDYAICRSERCRFGALKPVCSKCVVHCYKREKAEAIKKIMSYSGMRMIYCHPFLAIFHLYESWAFQPIDPRKK